MARTPDEDEFDTWQDVVKLFDDQDHETNDNLRIDKISVSSQIISTGPSGSRPPFASTSDSPHYERPNAEAAGDTLNVTTGSGLQGPHEHRDVDGTGVKIPGREPVSQTKRSARTKDKGVNPKRVRAPNWGEDEKHALLALKLEALVRGNSITEGASWSNYVSTQLKKKNDFDRASKSCQQQWDTLKKQYDTIREHESKILSGTSNCTSFWDMEEHERSELNEKLTPNEKLPQVFYFAWYVLMESIIQATMAAKRTPPKKGTTRIQVGANILASSSTHVQTSTVTIRSTSLSQLQPASDARRSSSSSQDILVSTIQAPNVALFSNLASTQGSKEPEEEVLGMSSPSSQGNKQQPADVKVLDLSNDIALISRIVNKQIEEKLEPFKSVWLNREEVEHRHREKILAIEKEKLALMREKMQFTHRTAISTGSFAGTLTHAQDKASLNIATTSLAQGSEHIDAQHG